MTELSPSEVGHIETSGIGISHHFTRLLVVAFASGILVTSFFHLREFPFVRFLDPGYQYLYNGVVVVQGEAPTHTDHPGTFLQWLSGTVSWLVHLFRVDSSSLTMDVAHNSTLYLKVNAIVLLLAFLLSFVLLVLKIQICMSLSIRIS